MSKELSATLTGISGEYFVAAELSRRGFIASITLKNTEGIDVLVVDPSFQKISAIQVKTAYTTGKTKSWILTEHDEHHAAANRFYAFVDLQGEGAPLVYIVPSKTVAKTIKDAHEAWCKETKKDGTPHKSTPMRKFVMPPDDRYLYKWDLLAS